ncbi:MAG TPA: hypothetical protein VH395_13460, partial [Jatrophihabitantaceae bacterium]
LSRAAPAGEGVMARDAARGLGALTVAVIGSLAVVVACTSNSAGNPLPASRPSPGPSIAGPSLSAPSLSAPAGVTASANVSASSNGSASTFAFSISVSAPSAGGGSKFCRDLIGQGRLGQLSGGGANADDVVSTWDKLAAEAPSEIKSDVKAVANFLRGELSGRIDPGAAAKLSTAATHIGNYVATHCR